MGFAPEVSFVVKHTFLEFSTSAGAVEAAKAETKSSLADTELLASAGLIVRTSAPHIPVAVVEASPAVRPSPWPETPMLDAIFEPRCPEEAEQWLLPEAFMTEQDEFNFQWMYQPWDGCMNMDMSAMQGTCWGGEWPCSESTTSGDLDTTSCGDSDKTPGQDWRTTVMLRNLPRELTRDLLVQMLEQKGLSCQYDLVYVPVDFSSGIGLGYAFVNSTLPAYVQNFWDAFDGLSEWPIESDKVCTVSWSDPHQGLYSHVERYRNSPVMHADVPDEWKPALFIYGMRTEFPMPTKKVKAPKVRCKKGAAEQKSDVVKSQ